MAEEELVFHTDIFMFCYSKMPFGLKNASTTYQKLMDKLFIDQFGKNLEVNVDAVVVKEKYRKSCYPA